MTIAKEGQIVLGNTGLTTSKLILAIFLQAQNYLPIIYLNSKLLNDLPNFVKEIAYLQILKSSYSVQDSQYRPIYYIDKTISYQP